MTLWQLIRCFFARESCAYNPDQDEWLATRVRPEREAAEQKTQAIRRLRAARVPLHDELFRVTSEEADHGR